MINKDFMQQVQVNDTNYSYFDLRELAKQGVGNIDRLPYTIRILVENLLRKLDGPLVEDSSI